MRPFARLANSDGQVAEAIGYIGLAMFSNLFNHVHDTPLDFPPAQGLDGSKTKDEN